MAKDDSGLGLSDFLAPSSPSPEAPAAEASPVAAEAAVEAAPEAKPEATAEAKDAAVTEKEKPQETAEAEKVEVKPAEEKKADAPQESAWEKEKAQYEQRIKETRDWASRVNNDSVEVKRQLAILNAKLDGTYDPAKHEKPAPTTDQIQSEAEIRGKVKASEVAAYAMYGGKEAVDAKLKDFNDRFGENQHVQYRVINSDAPIIEAMKVMREAELIGKYGSDPDQIVAAIRKEAETELEAKITDRVTKQIMARLDKQQRQAPTLTQVRGASREPDGAADNAPPPLTSIFPN